MSNSSQIKAVVRALIVAVACAFGSLPRAHADAAITLHMHFIPGETLTYNNVMVERGTVVVAGRQVDAFNAATTFQSHYIVHGVDSAGNATLSVVSDPGRTVRVRNRTTTRLIVQPNQFGMPVEACIQEADGTQYCVYRGGYGLGDFGQLAPGPVAIGASWTTTLDNTWDVDHPSSVEVRNMLVGVTNGVYGRVATIRSTEHVNGGAVYDAGGAHYNVRVRGSQSGTWQCGVESGMYLGQVVTQTIEHSGTVRDTKGTHALHSTYSISMTMHLKSNTVSAVHQLGRAYATTIVAPLGAGYRITFPSSWKRKLGARGNFQLTSPSGASLLLGGTAPSVGDSANPTFVAGFLHGFGTPIGAITGAVHTMHGTQFGVVDAVLRLKGTVEEAQVEVRLSSQGGVLHVLVGIVDLGPPGTGGRPGNAAREYAQMQRTLNSVTPTGAGV